MSVRIALMLACLVLPAATARGDGVLYRYEGDVLPLSDEAGWIVGSRCEPPCSESLGNGYFTLEWPYFNDLANYDYTIAQPPDKPPPTLWVEWRFRSNHPIGRNFDSCDGKVTVDYGGMHELIFMYGDAAVSFSGGDFVLGLELDAFHTYRYESLDGINYVVAVDGEIFIVDAGNKGKGTPYLQMRGLGGCGNEIPGVRNDWDYVRFGTIGQGEQIVSTDPPAGFLDPAEHGKLDRFAVTFDAANYVFITDVTVFTSAGAPPMVTKTWRRENDGLETLEIVLDRPFPPGERTWFVIDDGQTINTVQYTFVRGDADANGQVDLADTARFQSCFGESPVIPTCKAFDFNSDDTINLSDLPDFLTTLALMGP